MIRHEATAVSHALLWRRCIMALTLGVLLTLFAGCAGNRVLFQPKPLDRLTTEEVNEELDCMTYILTPGDRKKLESMDDDARREYLLLFWGNLDPRVRVEYLQRVETANQRFHVLRKDGWRTDRGRIYCLFGEPDEIYEQVDGMPLQVWWYQNIEGGVIFIFYDRNRDGDYVQVHSNKSGERMDPSWMSYFSQGAPEWLRRTFR